jgi:hypothetical protein
MTAAPRLELLELVDEPEAEAPDRVEAMRADLQSFSAAFRAAAARDRMELARAREDMRSTTERLVGELRQDGVDGGTLPGVAKIGRPRAPEADLRRHRVVLQLTDAELARLAAMAAAESLPLATAAHRAVQKALDAAPELS